VLALLSNTESFLDEFMSLLVSAVDIVRLNLLCDCALEGVVDGMQGSVFAASVAAFCSAAVQVEKRSYSSILASIGLSGNRRSIIQREYSTSFMDRQR
jgi:hypothetical protein